MSGVRELAERLELPVPVRSEFLDEVAGDLEGLYEELRARGLGRNEAWRAAADMLLPDDHTLRALSALHRPLWVRWAERLTGTGSAADAAVLTVLTSIVLLTTLGALLNGGVLAPLSWSLAPVFAMGVAESALIAWHIFRVFIRAETHADRVRRGARLIAMLAVAAAVVGASGAGAGFARAAAAAAAAADPAGPLLHWIPTAVAQLSLGLVIALEGGLAWMLLARRAARIEHDATRTVARIRRIHFPATVS